MIFTVTHPLGLPRPLDRDNFFGAKGRFFALNAMPVPAGCLAHFDGAVYRPHARRLVSILRQGGGDWSGPAMIGSPARYCLLESGGPARVPAELRPLLPEPPWVTFEAVLAHFDVIPWENLPLQLLDVLTLVSEDLRPADFAAATAKHPWVAEFMR